MKFVLLMSVLVSASPHLRHETKHGLVSYNASGVCITAAAVDHAVDIALEELMTACTDWHGPDAIQAMKDVKLFWRSEPWMAESGSCADSKMKVERPDGGISCPVVGLYANGKLYVMFSGVWDETLPHEMAHLFQDRLSHISDVRHAQFKVGSCIHKALAATVARYNKEMYNNPEFNCTNP